MKNKYTIAVVRYIASSVANNKMKMSGHEIFGKFVSMAFQVCDYYRFMFAVLNRI